MQPITIGTKASASVQVTEAQLAVTVGSGSLRVFATPMPVSYTHLTLPTTERV